MGAGKYIGRVGALAVALGVGTAVGSGYGLAWADTTGTTGSSSSESSSSSSSTSGSTDTGSNTTSTTGESTTGTGTTNTGTTTTGTITGSTSSSETTSGSHTSESSTSGSTSTSGTQTSTGSTTTVSTGSGSASDPKSTLSAQTVVESGTEKHSTSQPTSSAPTPTVDKPTEPTPTKEPTPDPSTPEPPAQHQTPPENKSSATPSSNSPQPATTAAAVRVPSATSSSIPEPAATPATAPTTTAPTTTSLLNRSVLTALPAPTTTAVSLLSPVVIPPPVATPSVVAQAVTSLLSVFGIDLLAGTTPVAPAQPPVLWGLLAWVRRQLADAIPGVPQVATTTTSLVTSQPIDAVSPDLGAAASPAATVAEATPSATVAEAAPTATDPATLDAVPTAFAAESMTLDAATPDATQPTDVTAAEPMMMMAAAEPVSSVVETPTTFAAPVMLAAATVAAPAPAFPAAGAQLSPSTNFISWLTGNFPDNYTLSRFGINGTDVGIIWDNGMVDDPATPYNEHQLLIAFGDTFGDPNAPGQQWRSNVLLRTSDLVLSDGMSIPNGTVINAADLSTYFGGAPLVSVNFAKQIINDPNLGPAVTIIPTAGISVPTPGTMFGVTQYINFMAVQQWGNPGYWTTSYSAIAYSQDNGQNWTVAPSTVRLNQWWTGNQNFQQASYLRPGDGFVYMYGTPNGRQGNAYLARVPEQSMLDLTKYQYWNGSAAAVPGQPGPAGQWITGNPAAATALFPIQQVAGACGALSQGPGSTTSEMSVQYNAYLKKYIAMYTDQNNSVVMRTSDTPQGSWSYAKTLLNQQPGGIYAPMMNPWSPSTKGNGSDLYWNLSLFSTYDVMQMRTDLSKVN